MALFADTQYFYPRSPCGERPADNQEGERTADISIHALLAESDVKGKPASPVIGISIHALLAESDTTAANALQSKLDISIHALLAESDSFFMAQNLKA